MMRYIQARRHLRSSDKILAPDEDKLPRSRPGALISQTMLHCIVEKKKTRKHPSFEEHDATEMARAVLLKRLFSGEIHSGIYVEINRQSITSGPRGLDGQGLIR